MSMLVCLFPKKNSLPPHPLLASCGYTAWGVALSGCVTCSRSASCLALGAERSEAGWVELRVDCCERGLLTCWKYIKTVQRDGESENPRSSSAACKWSLILGVETQVKLSPASEAREGGEQEMPPYSRDERTGKQRASRSNGEGGEEDGGRRGLERKLEEKGEKKRSRNEKEVEVQKILT